MDTAWHSRQRRDRRQRQPAAHGSAAGRRHFDNGVQASYTLFNSSKHYQFNQDFAIYKGGWWGSHNFKFGYQLNHLSNIIDQNGNVPQVAYNLGVGQSA